jgi:hypothetical protein
VKDPTQPNAIIGRFEIKEIFGVSRQHTQAIIDDPRCPPPICVIGKNRSPLFWRRDIEAFKALRAREEKPAAAPAAA